MTLALALVDTSLQRLKGEYDLFWHTRSMTLTSPIGMREKRRDANVAYWYARR